MARRRPLSLMVCAVTVALCGAAQHWHCAAGQQWPYPPRVRADPAQVSISGISSGADFATQFHVAFSSLITVGIGVFAGEPYHCAVTRFPGDAPGQPLIYDHCKNHPQWVNVSTLVEYAREMCAAGFIDDPANIKDHRVYLYHGTKDPCYLPGSVQKTADFYSLLVDDPSKQLLFEDTIPSMHCMPTMDYGHPCGTEPGPPGGIEKCGYDGAGSALQHLYPGLAVPTGPADDSRIFSFSQRPFFDNVSVSGLADRGFMYVPKACDAQQQVYVGTADGDSAAPGADGAGCKFHVFTHGCGMAFSSPAFNLTYVMHAGFNTWAEANDIVVLYPQMGGFKNGTHQMMDRCWDSYGQTGSEYAVQSGLQMATLRRMIRAITGL